ncbi:hypothetical protein JRO89_XS02G0044000 [Xanthoceras sorbifolium]|uniref:Uncharacterized protein n=1 Tax=Xanthoceras sorbifolium TaxID=99658 RepID=A0ABQ8IEI3_9ROSI|nr:hypothetical protein JRO89_XS02G0044000 [Xanthoceras sorbifolium]
MKSSLRISSISNPAAFRSPSTSPLQAASMLMMKRGFSRVLSCSNVQESATSFSYLKVIRSEKGGSFVHNFQILGCLGCLGKQVITPGREPNSLKCSIAHRLGQRYDRACHDN